MVRLSRKFNNISVTCKPFLAKNYVKWHKTAKKT